MVYMSVFVVCSTITTWGREGEVDAFDPLFVARSRRGVERERLTRSTTCSLSSRLASLPVSATAMTSGTPAITSGADNSRTWWYNEELQTRSSLSGRTLATPQRSSSR